MRYVFIVNPVAGKRNPYNTVFPLVKEYLDGNGIEYTCHITNQPRQATELARQQGERGDPVRVYAVGGDGTLSETAAGAVGLKNVEIGVIPCGSGNDYVKSFAPQENFLSMEKQIGAPSRPVDMIRSGERCSLNICSIGMDARVGYEMAGLKNLPMISGPMAYNFALAKVLLGKIGDRLEVTIDGKDRFAGDFLFAVAASGRWYGGGYLAAPRAQPDDGLLDFVLIRKPPFFRIPKLVGIYKQGGHLESEEFRGILTFCRGKEMTVAARKDIVANFDGECRRMRRASFRVIPHAVRFIVPE